MSDDPRLADTGWRYVASLLTPDWTVAISAGSVRLRRTGNVVTLTVRVGPTAGIHGTPISARRQLLSVPAGFAPSGYHWAATGYANGAGIVAFDSQGALGRVDLIAGNGNFTPSMSFVGEFSWVTSQAWPLELPGTPA